MIAPQIISPVPSRIQYHTTRRSGAPIRPTQALMDCQHRGALVRARFTLTTHPGILVAGFNFRGDQADLVDPRGVRDIDNARDVLEGNVVIGLYKHDLLGANFENVG